MSREYPRVQISDEMIFDANQFIKEVKVYRTAASKIDALTGILGEFAFAQFFFGDWKKHRIPFNKGEVDFGDIEIKTSAFPFNEKLHLLVRKEYAAKRTPLFYVQVILDVDSEKADNIQSGTNAYICGFAESGDVEKAPKRDFGSKIGSRGGYRCHFIHISQLQPMDTFRDIYESRLKEKENRNSVVAD